MTEIKLTLSCGLCPAEHRTVIQAPDGWAATYDEIDSEGGFCPKHAAVRAFKDSQCPGCVEDWGECEMWQAFAYSGGRDISPRDIEIIRTELCPRRTNGTFSFSQEDGLQGLSLSERSPTAAGTAFADAIEEHIKRYPEGS